MCQIFFFLVFLLSMVGDPYEGFLTIPTGIINNIFTQQMINLDPVEDGFLLGSYLGSSTIFTGKVSNYLNGHKIFLFCISILDHSTRSLLPEFGSFLFVQFHTEDKVS